MIAASIVQALGKCVKSVLYIAAIWKQYFTAGHYESI